MSLSYVDAVDNWGTASVFLGAYLDAPTARQSGDLLIATCIATKSITGVSTGWTQIANTGSGSAYVGAWWRIADLSSNDRCTVQFSANGSRTMGMAAVRSTVGFDSGSIQSHSENVVSSAASTYALTTTLSGVTAGQLSLCLAGHCGSVTDTGNTCSITGTAWTAQRGGGQGGALGGCSGGTAAGTCTTTGTPAIPSWNGNGSLTLTKAVFAAVITEAVAGGLAGGLFFGSA